MACSFPYFVNYIFRWLPWYIATFSMSRFIFTPKLFWMTENGWHVAYLCPSRDTKPIEIKFLCLYLCFWGQVPQFWYHFKLPTFIICKIYMNLHSNELKIAAMCHFESISRDMKSVDCKFWHLRVNTFLRSRNTILISL